MIPLKLTRDELVGKKCRPLRTIRNGAGAIVDENTVCTIVDVVRGHGFTIQKAPCPCCHVAVRISGISRDSLKLVERDASPSPGCKKCGVFPISKEELMEMPLHTWVWIEVLQPMRGSATESAYFRKCDVHNPEECFACGYPGWSTAFDYADYGTGWLAYRYEPRRDSSWKEDPA